MTDIEKFRSDIQRIVKRERADNGGRYNAHHACEQASKLLENEVRDLGELPGALAYYWMTTYIDTSAAPDIEPTPEHVDKLGAILAFLEGSTEDGDLLSQDDWMEIGRLTGYEAEDLPIDILTSLMTILVDRKAVE